MDIFEKSLKLPGTGVKRFRWAIAFVAQPKQQPAAVFVPWAAGQATNCEPVSTRNQSAFPHCSARAQLRKVYEVAQLSTWC